MGPQQQQVKKTIKTKKVTVVIKKEPSPPRTLKRQGAIYAPEGKRPALVELATATGHPPAAPSSSTNAASMASKEDMAPTSSAASSSSVRPPPRPHVFVVTCEAPSNQR